MEQVFQAILSIDGISLTVDGQQEPADFDLASILENCPELVASGGSVSFNLVSSLYILCRNSILT